MCRHVVAHYVDRLLYLVQHFVAVDGLRVDVAPNNVYVEVLHFGVVEDPFELPDPARLEAVSRLVGRQRTSYGHIRYEGNR
jgi:hypothetical protein